MEHIQRAARILAVAVWSMIAAAPLAAAPQRVPNRQPYRVTKSATVTGRTGSATVSARALLDRDQRASLEVVAGEFDSVVPDPGTLAKIQVKSYDGNGDSLFTDNYTGLDTASVALAYAGRVHGQALEVQSNVRNVDRNRTDVVTVTNVVRLRPDLAVRAISTPAVARVGSFVHITGIVAELNHDTGARATCALSIDDVAIDLAEGIWVDAGNTVSCAFTHIFDGPGIHAVRVAAANVNPGDWDLDNNSATSSIAVVTGEQAFEFVVANAGEWSRRHFYHESMYARRPQSSGALVWTFENRTDNIDDAQGGNYHAHFRGLAQFPLTQLSVSQWTDDRVVHQAVYRSLAAQRVWNGGGCGEAFDDADQSAYVEVCTYSPGFGDPPFTTLTHGRFAGTMTFYSSHYDAQWFETPDGIVPIYSFSYNISTGGTGGTRVPLGDTYRFEVTLVTGGIAYSFPVSFGLPPMQIFSDINRPWSCREFDEPTLGYKRFCDELILFSAGRLGSFSRP